MALKYLFIRLCPGETEFLAQIGIVGRIGGCGALLVYVWNSVTPIRYHLLMWIKAISEQGITFVEKGGVQNMFDRCVSSQRLY